MEERFPGVTSSSRTVSCRTSANALVRIPFVIEDSRWGRGRRRRPSSWSPLPGSASTTCARICSRRQLALPPGNTAHDRHGADLVSRSKSASSSCRSRCFCSSRSSERPTVARAVAFAIVLAAQVDRHTRGPHRRRRSLRRHPRPLRALLLRTRHRARRRVSAGRSTWLAAAAVLLVAWAVFLLPFGALDDWWFSYRGHDSRPRADGRNPARVQDPVRGVAPRCWSCRLRVRRRPHPDEASARVPGLGDDRGRRA